MNRDPRRQRCVSTATSVEIELLGIDRVMQTLYDDGTLVLRDAPDDVPHAEWGRPRCGVPRADLRYRALRAWAGAWLDRATDEQTTLHDGFGYPIEDTARAYIDLALTSALYIEPHDYQQAALDGQRIRTLRQPSVRQKNAQNTLFGWGVVTRKSVLLAGLLNDAVKRVRVINTPLLGRFWYPTVDSRI